MGRSLTPRESCYSRLRSLGVSVEVADAVALPLSKMKEAKQNLIWEWLLSADKKQWEVAAELGIHRVTLAKALHELRFSLR